MKVAPPPFYPWPVARTGVFKRQDIIMRVTKFIESLSRFFDPLNHINIQEDGKQELRKEGCLVLVKVIPGGRRDLNGGPSVRCMHAQKSISVKLYPSIRQALTKVRNRHKNNYTLYKACKFMLYNSLRDSPVVRGSCR